MFANFNLLTIKDGEGFSVPNYGGPLAVKYNTIAFGDTTAKNLFTLPKGAIPIAWITNVTTAFNSSGTDLLDIGTPAAAARFANDIDVSSVGQKLTGYVPAELFTPLTEDTQITGLYAQSVADAAAGAAVVACIYMLS
jgi:hypothetical protein